MRAHKLAAIVAAEIAAEDEDFGDGVDFEDAAEKVLAVVAAAASAYRSDNWPRLECWWQWVDYCEIEVTAVPFSVFHLLKR